MATKSNSNTTSLKKNTSVVEKLIHIFGSVNFVFLLCFLGCLIAGVICVFVYKGDNDMLRFIITETISASGISETIKVNGIIAIFCFVFVLFFFLTTLAEVTLVIVSKKGHLSKKQCFFTAYYALTVILTFSLVTAGLFLRLDPYRMTNTKYDVGFYHIWDENKQTLSLLGYFTLAFSLCSLCLYFPYKKSLVPWSTLNKTK